MNEPTSQRRAALNQLQERRRRRGFLLGLLAGQVLIIALDLGGSLFLSTHPQVKIQAPIGVPSIVFLGMAAGAALLVSVIALGTVVARNGIRRILRSAISMGVTIGVIVGTAWFMIPEPERAPTIRFAHEKGLQGVDASKAKARSMFRAP